MTPATLLVNPVTMSAGAPLWLQLPLCAAVAIVYKTVRAAELRRLPLEIAGAIGYIITGLVLLGVGLWVIQELAL